MGFQKATKEQSKARIALMGPAGSGKSYTSLRIAETLGGKVAAIDTENRSLSKYADEFDFDVLNLDNYHPQNYIDAIKMAEQAGYDVLIIDSLTHAWSGKGGALEIKDRAAARSKENSFTAWREVTPLHNSLVEAMLSSRLHIIVTMRVKTEYVVTTNERGKQAPQKVGLAPIQRDGLEYEFDIVADLDAENTLTVGKTRCRALKGYVKNMAGEEFGQIVKNWLTDGAPSQEQIIQARYDLKAWADSNGISTQEMRFYGKSCPDVQREDTSTWMPEDCEKIKQYIEQRIFPQQQGEERATG